jgi:predicted DNA-binding protein (MmcQ/YjbR family)
MTYEKFDRLCARLPAATRVVQWRGSRVWKVGPKVFAIGGWGDEIPAFTFKVDEDAYDFLRDQPGLRPAPYLASRGMKWIQQYTHPGLSDVDLRGFINQSHHLVSIGLTKKLQRELGLLS